MDELWNINTEIVGSILDWKWLRNLTFLGISLENNHFVSYNKEQKYTIRFSVRVRCCC